MARTVPAWLHRICIRDYGPDDALMKLALLTVNTCFGSETDKDTGEKTQLECWWGQERLAHAASMGVTTLRRKLTEASKLGWIAIYPRGANGQRWKSYAYQPCIPDHIPLTEQFEALADAHAAIHGNPTPAATSGSRYPQKGQRRAPAAAAGSKQGVNTEGPAADDTKHRPLTHEAPAADDEKDRPQRRGKSYSKFHSEVPQEEGRLSPTPGLGTKSAEREDRDPTSPQDLGALPIPASAVARGSARKEEPDADDQRAIDQLLDLGHTAREVARSLKQRGITLAHVEVMQQRRDFMKRRFVC